MLSNILAALRRLPSQDRIELAMALWESLTDEEREAEFVLTPEQEAEIDRRLEEHLANPGSAIPWRRCEGSSRAARDAAPCIST
jgi:putative addiction module component (TIGR02574 family)